MKFRTTLLQAGKTTTGVEVLEAMVVALGGGKRPPVRVTINGYAYRSTIAPMNGRFMLGVSADVRAAANVTGGEEVNIELELDTAPREVSMPPQLVKALAKNPAAKKAFESLSYSKKQRYTLPIENAKTDETRQRNVDKALSELQNSPA